MNKTRLYSVCLVLDETVFNYHRILIDNLSKLQIKEKIIPPQIKPNEILNDYLQIYVKKYDVPNALSKYIHEFSSRSEEDDFFAKGPIVLKFNI